MIDRLYYMYGTRTAVEGDDKNTDMVSNIHRNVIRHTYTHEDARVNDKRVDVYECMEIQYHLVQQKIETMNLFCST